MPNFMIGRTTITVLCTAVFFFLNSCLYFALFVAKKKLFSWILVEEKQQHLSVDGGKSWSKKKQRKIEKSPNENRIIGIKAHNVEIIV